MLLKDEVLIGNCVFLKNWIIRSETSDALDKLFVKNNSNWDKEEELNLCDEKVIVPNISLRQRDKNTDLSLFILFISKNTVESLFI